MENGAIKRSNIKIQDRIGTIVNGFYLLNSERRGGRTYVLTICPVCKNKKWMRLDTITSGKIVSCGCYNRENNLIQPKNIAGKKYGRLTAIKPTEKRDKHNRSVIWECECECGKKKKVPEYQLEKNVVLSCGCLQREKRVENGKKVGKSTVENACFYNTNIHNLTSKIPKNNTSGIKGVFYDNRKQKWKAHIEFQGKKYFLGYYRTKEEAAEVRAEAEERIFGGFLEWFYENHSDSHRNANEMTL